MKKRVQTIRIILAVALYFLFLSIQLNAQICNGSLGDPVVNVTFGSGNNPGPALPAGTNNYSFTSSTCPNDGSYTIVNSTAGCFGNSWQTLSEDHTPGDANGYMMLVNASIDTGDFYLNTVQGLCANTQYEFSAWVTNVLLPSSCGGSGTRPKLTFKIETPSGTLLGAYNTGDIFSTTSPVWKQYGFFFTTPANSSTIVIRITNNAPGGCGNDLALDDITFRPCGPTVTAGFANVSTPLMDLCKGNLTALTLSATVSSGYTAPAYRWQLYDGTDWVDIPGATSLTYLRPATPATGTYQYRLTVAEGTNISISNCRVASNEVVVTIHDLPTGTATNDGPVCEGTTLNLSATGGTSYQWTGPAGYTAAVASPGFITTGNSAGQYTVVVSDAFGCTDTNSTMVATFPIPVALVSNAATICGGDSVLLQASGGNSYAWLPVAGLSDAAISNPIAKPASTTTYIITVTGNNNCSDTASVIVSVNSRPVVNAGADKAIIKGQSVTLDGSITNASNVNFSWRPSPSLSDISLLNPVASPIINTDYILNASSTIGCGVSADTVSVKVYNDLYIPTAFSPNGDAHNPTWRIEALQAYPGAVVSVFNRLGEKVFESTASAMTKGWDGTYKNTDQPPGAYVYLIDLRNKRPVIKGTVMLIR